MLKINLTTLQRTTMVKRHSRYTLPLIKKRMKRPTNLILKKYFKNDKLIREVLETPSDLLLALNSKVWQKLRLFAPDTQIKGALERTFSPSSFFSKKTPKYNAYDLCKSLGLATCPYCNIIPIPTVITLRPRTLVVRPPLDHFFASTHFPLLAVSFFNVVPGCDTCNSRFKLAAPTNHLTHLNPHVGEFGEDFVFKLSGYKKLDDIIGPMAEKFKIELENRTADPRFDGNESLFHLNTMYQMQAPTARLCLIKAMSYSKATIKSIQNTARSSGSEPYALIFDCQFDLEKLHLFPLSKLKRDLVKKYGSADLKIKLGI